MEGTGTTTIGGKEYDFADGMFSIIRPRTPHNEVHRSMTELVCIGFGMNESDAIRLENGVFRDQSRLLLLLAKKIKHEVMSKRMHFDLKLKLLMNEFLIEIERTRSDRSTSDSFEQVESFINENFSEAISLAALASLSGYSYHHFRHMFKMKTGVSPLSYIMYKRIDYAKKLMLSTGMSMSTISQNCGFSNSSQFSTTFHKITGLTPSEYKRKHFIQ